METEGKIKIRMIALDLDETTLDSSSHLPERNRRALARAAEKGVEIVIASGRSYVSMSRVIPEFPWTRYAICSNGASVNSTSDGSILTQYFLSENTVREILKRSAGEFLTYEAYVDGQAYSQQDYIAHPEQYMADDFTVAYVQSTRKPVPDILKFIEAHIQELQSLVIVYGSAEIRQRVEKRLQGLENAYITSSVPRMTEISDLNCGKHRGLQFLSELLEIKREEIAAFGNADNDTDMLSWAGIGAAVSNASELCKASADIVTGHFLECGVAQVLEKLEENGAY